MDKKEIPIATKDAVTQMLERIERSTIAEEDARQERGLTQEPPSKRIKREKPIPIGDFIPPKKSIDTRGLEELGVKPAEQDKQLELREKDIEYYLADWEHNNRDYELTHLSQGATIKPERESANLSIEFVDFLIDGATKSDMREDDRGLLFSILRNLNKVIIYDIASTIQIGLRDNERNLIRLDFKARPPFALIGISVVG